jgi:tetratricopeptide (TPR) repeat protein
MKKTGDGEAARRHYTEALEIVQACQRGEKTDLNPADSHFVLAKLLEKKGDVEAARRHYTKAVEIDPSIRRDYEPLDHQGEERFCTNALGEGGVGGGVPSASVSDLFRAARLGLLLGGAAAAPKMHACRFCRST